MTQSHDFVEAPGGFTDGGGNHVAAVCLLMCQDTVLHMGQRVADDFGGDRLGLQGHAVLQVSDTEQGHKGDGDVGFDASGGPVVDGSYLEIVLTYPEGIFDLPQAAVLA